MEMDNISRTKLEIAMHVFNYLVERSDVGAVSVKVLTEQRQVKVRFDSPEEGFYQIGITEDDDPVCPMCLSKQKLPKKREKKRVLELRRRALSKPKE